MKAEHRKELETNLLADKVGHLLSGAKQGPTRGTLFYVAIGLVALVAVFLLYRWYATTVGRTGPQWVMLEDGSQERFEEIIKASPMSNPGKASRLQLAYEDLWIRGVKKLGANPIEAFQSIDNAERAYQKIAEDCKGDPVFQPEALFGLAVIEETKAIKDRAHLVTALEKYKDVVKANKDSAFAQLASNRISELEDTEKSRNIQKFYQEMGFNLKRLEQRNVPPGLEELEKMFPGMKK